MKDDYQAWLWSPGRYKSVAQIVPETSGHTWRIPHVETPRTEYGVGGVSEWFVRLVARMRDCGCFSFAHRPA